MWGALDTSNLLLSTPELDPTRDEHRRRTDGDQCHDEPRGQTPAARIPVRLEDAPVVGTHLRALQYQHDFTILTCRVVVPVEA